MTATASDPWFWNDWQGEPLLRLCSMAAQGFWMRLLCIAAESKKKGYVLINGRKPTHAELASIAGQSLPDVEMWLEELDRNGVYSTTRDGIIYNRKMVRDAKKRAASKKGGKIGGPVSLEKQTGIHATRTPTRDATRGGTRHPRRAPLPSPLPIPKEEEERTSMSAAGSEGPLASHMTEDGFAKWWKACHSTIPKRSSRPQSLKQWLKLPPVPVELMIAAWDAYLAQNAADSEKQKYKIQARSPEEWFRNRIHENFLDEIRAKEKARLDRQHELADTIQRWNGHADEVIKRITLPQFEAIFLGSKFDETKTSVNITTQREFQASKAEQSPTIMDVLERVFKPKAIVILSPTRVLRARAG